MPKKNKIFSGRKYNPRGSTKRAAKKFIQGIFDTENVENLSLEDRRDLKAYLKSRQKTIVESENHSGSIAREFQLKTKVFTDDARELLRAHDEQEMYFEQAQYDADIEARKNDDEEFKAMVDDDKWTILRRLATEDIMLNIDRAYASETLHKIENMIVQNRDKMTYQELADQLLEEYREQKEESESMTAGLKPFRKPNSLDVEEQALAANRGFHGVDKAMSKWKSNLANKSENVAAGLSAFTPAWQRVDMSLIDWTQMDDEE